MRWIVRGLIGLGGLIALVLVVIYGGSQWKLRRGHDVAAMQLAIPKDAASVAEGARLARITGCRDCHGPSGEGTVLMDNPVLGRIAPPALAPVAARYSDAELERAIRHGVRRDGSALYVMPTNSHTWLSDDDTAKIIAWLRTLRAKPGDSPATTSFGPLGRALILAGALPSSVHPATVSAKVRPADMGRYIVDVSCTGCHALHNERPSDDGKQIVPPLAAVAAAYDLPGFTRLIKTGIGRANRDLGLMTSAARGGLSALSDDEIRQVHGYLTLEAMNAPPQ